MRSFAEAETFCCQFWTQCERLTPSSQTELRLARRWAITERDMLMSDCDQRESAWRLRRMLTRPGTELRLSIWIEGITLVADQHRNEAAIEELNERLRWKLGVPDPLLDQFPKRLFVSGDGPLVCPVDGPVMPVRGQTCSNRESWDLRHGRHWGLLLCPKCLFIFAETLVSMN